MNEFAVELSQLFDSLVVVRDSRDWTTTGEYLGTAPPADYAGWIERYGGGLVDNYLLLLEPDSRSAQYDLFRAGRDRDEAFKMLADLVPLPEQLEAGGRLIPWATTDNGEWLYWLANPAISSDDWTVIIEAEGEPEWEHFPMGCIEFLAAVLSRSVTSEVLWSDFPADMHEFRPASTF